MRLSLRRAFAVCLAFVFTGCAAMHERRIVREDFSPEPMSPRAWSQVVGTYAGPVRSSNRRFGTNGDTTADMLLEVSGSPVRPLVFLKMRADFTSALIFYGERTEVFTNIPERRYRVKGDLEASSHEPDQLLVQLKAQPLSPTLGAFLVVTFRGNGCADVDFIEHAGRRGEGILKRLPVLPGACRE